MIERITKKTLLEKIAEEQLGTIVDKEAVDRTPNTRGIAKTANGNHMVYCVDANGKLHHTSVHKNKREANGRLLERMRALAQA